jgi:hypothetical protein
MEELTRQIAELAAQRDQLATALGEELDMNKQLDAELESFRAARKSAGVRTPVPRPLAKPAPGQMTAQQRALRARDRQLRLGRGRGRGGRSGS